MPRWNRTTCCAIRVLSVKIVIRTASKVVRPLRSEISKQLNLKENVTRSARLISTAATGQSDTVWSLQKEISIPDGIWMKHIRKMRISKRCGANWMQVCVKFRKSKKSVPVILNSVCWNVHTAANRIEGRPTPMICSKFTELLNSEQYCFRGAKFLCWAVPSQLNKEMLCLQDISVRIYDSSAVF